jgi:hypothetical protein
MMLAAILLLSHFPLVGNADIPVSNPAAIVDESPKPASPAATPRNPKDAKELIAPRATTPVTISEVSTAPVTGSEVSTPSMPQPKVNSDADPSFADPAVPEPHPFAFQPVKPALRHGYITRNEKMTWYSLLIAEHAGAVLDAWSTRRALSGNYGREADPLMRPFAHSGTIYLATQVTPFLMDILSRRLMTSERPWLHKLWWVPQSTMASVSFEAGIHNIGVVH